MPALRWAGRKLRLASDDFVMPGACSAVGRFLWTTLLVSFAFAADADMSECPWTRDLVWYLIFMACVGAVGLVVDVALAVLSARGAILDPSPRANVPQLLTARALVSVVEVALNVLGSVWAFRSNSTSCDFASWVSDADMFRAIVIVRWCLFCIVLCALPGVVQCPGQLTPERMASRCRALFCCTRWSSEDDRDAVFQNIGRMLHRLFGAVDLVPSDVAAGLLLVRARQRAEAAGRARRTGVAALGGDSSRRLQVAGTPRSERDGDRSPQTPRRSVVRLHHHVVDGAVPLSAASADDRRQLSDAAHFMRYAFGIYGWKLFVFAKPLTGCCRLAHCRCKPCTPCTGGPLPQVRGDSCTACYQVAMLRGAGIDEANLLYASLSGAVSRTVFAVVADHARRAVVVVVRGTLSLEDCLTDARADGAPLGPHLGSAAAGADTGEWRAHEGMLEAARRVVDDLAESGVLAAVKPAAGAGEALPEPGAPDPGLGQRLVDESGRLPRLPDYELVVCGHSLGAGTATLVACLLKQHYPDLRCFAFSPPGGLLSLPAANWCDSFVTSIVTGKDLVPRLSFFTLERLQAEVVQELAHARVPKHSFLGQSCRALVCGAPPAPAHTAQVAPLPHGEPAAAPTEGRVVVEVTDRPTDRGAGASAGEVPAVGAGADDPACAAAHGAAAPLAAETKVSEASPLRAEEPQWAPHYTGEGAVSAEAARILAQYRRWVQSQRASHGHEQLYLPGRVLHVTLDHRSMRRHSCCGRCMSSCRSSAGQPGGAGTWDMDSESLLLSSAAHGDPGLCGRLAWTCCSSQVFRASWADRREFQHILISASMGLDHFPHRVLDWLQRTAAQMQAGGEQDVEVGGGEGVVGDARV